MFYNATSAKFWRRLLLFIFEISVSKFSSLRQKILLCYAGTESSTDWDFKRHDNKVSDRKHTIFDRVFFLTTIHLFLKSLVWKYLERGSKTTNKSRSIVSWPFKKRTLVLFKAGICRSSTYSTLTIF